ncbi:MAG: T9SS C-terminal target domain-containing protein [Balneolaceae bacterium]|nr:MAG: T9SS C-terminal target domain-containing protein [Balneolaceae bacterium]
MKKITSVFLMSATLPGLISATLLIMMPWQAASAQDMNAHPHHPARILIMFNADSPVLSELNAYHESQKSDHDAQELPGNIVITADQMQAFPEAGSFMSSQGLLSLQKLVVTSVKRKSVRPGTSARERMYVGVAEHPANLMDLIGELRSHPEITHAEPDYIGQGSGQRGLPAAPDPRPANSDAAPNDRFFHLQWGLQNTGQIIAETSGISGEDINIIPAWDITTGSSDITMAVLDSGQPDDVPDFEDRVVPGYNFVSDIPSTADDHGHGTNVASIALATGNNNGTMAGIDWNARIMPVKILDENNSGLYSWWIAGIYWAKDAGADVLNMSVGGSGPSSLLSQAVADAIDAGIHVIACMMNTNNNVTFYPAGYEGVVSVGAINNAGVLAVPFCWGGGSNYGDHIDLVAPGDYIVGLSHTNPLNGSYWCGTSQAAPMAAGVVSLMLSVNPELSPAEAKQILRETARGEGWNRFTGTGVLDAHAAVAFVKENRETRAVADVSLNIRLEQNYPNPFNPSTSITFQIPEQSHVTLSVFTADGRRAGILVDEVKAAGTHVTSFDASGLSSGVYLYEMTAAGQRNVRRMTLVK